MTHTTFTEIRTPAEITRLERDFGGKPMQSFIINGKKIKTNYGACEYPYWDGNTSNVPEKYSRFGTIKKLGFRQSSTELFNYLVDCGYDEIRVVLVASGQIFGYCDEFFWACKSEVVKARKNEIKEEKKAKELEEAKENMVEAIKICCGINQPEPEKATESITEAHRICNDSCDNWNYYSGAWNKLRCVHCMEKRSTDDLRKERARMSKMNQKEYETRGNTKRCQGLFAHIELIDAEIERRTRS